MKKNILSKLSAKHHLLFASAITLFITICLYIVGSNAGQGVFITSEPDSLIYMQYAKAIAEGTPYIFSTGDTPSTGSTSHLYPFILALFYKLGATGNKLFTAAYWLNGLFLLGTIVNIALFAKKFSAKTWKLALLLICLSGQIMSAHLGQTDMGLLCFLTTSIFASILYKKPHFYTPLIIMLSISRPEGAIFSAIFIALSILRLTAHYRFHQTLPPSDLKQVKLILLSGTLGLAVFGGILLLNHALTGYSQFMSTLNKGYFNNYPLPTAISLTGHDLLNIYKGYFWGLPAGARELYAPPIIAALLGLVGIITRKRSDAHELFTELLIAATAGAVILMISTSGWQGLSADRYIAWIMPFWLCYICMGLSFVQNTLKKHSSIIILPAILIGFQAAMLPIFIADYHRSSVIQSQRRNFYSALNQQLPPESLVGQYGKLGYQYIASNIVLKNLSGIETPVFASDDPAFASLQSFEVIKHNPALRFDYWILTKAQADAYPLNQFATNQIFEASDQLGTAGMARLYKSKWDSLQGGLKPVTIQQELKDKELIGMLDIGYDVHRKKHAYTTHCRIKNTKIRYGICTHPLGDLEAYTEIGLPIIGYEAFTITADPTKDLYLALRTGKKLEVNIQTAVVATTSPEISSPAALNIMVNDQLIETKQVTLNDEGYTEVIITIPAKHLTHDQSEIVIGGDHISFAYWFYQ